MPVEAIIDRTPSCLRKIYRGQLALPLYDGDEHQRVCLRVMLRACNPDPPPQRTWKVGRDGGAWTRRVRVDVPPLLEMAQSARV